jgi:mannosyltransferase
MSSLQQSTEAMSRAGFFPADNRPWWVDMREVEVVAPNFKRRLSGVTSTLERVVPLQARSVKIAALGPVLPPHVPRIRFRDLLRIWSHPAGRAFRVWHARRNVEMLAGVVLRNLLGAPLKLVFTSASQREHTAWTRFLIRRMDALISTSSRTASYLKHPSTVIRHGIDPDQFRPVADKTAQRARLGLPNLRFVGCFGRIRRQKGTDVFMDAMIRLLPSRPDAGAIVLGRALGKHRLLLTELKRKVKLTGLSDRIFFPTEVPPSQTPDWYAALDVFVAPQRWEGFGVTPLEAMASGVPVVATSVGAFPELVVPEVTGAIIPPGDVEEMVREVGRLLDEAARLAQLGVNARRHVTENLSLTAEAEGINAVYRNL